MYILKLFEIVDFEPILVRKKSYPNENGQCSKAVSELSKWEKECKADPTRTYKIVFDFVAKDKEVLNIGTIRIKGGTIE